MFKGKATFNGNSIITTTLLESSAEAIPWADEEIGRKGGAIHNKVLSREELRDRILVCDLPIIILCASVFLLCFEREETVTSLCTGNGVLFSLYL